jgi:hypothetical protein
VASSPALRWSMPVRVSQRLTGVPAAVLAASRSMCRSPLLLGSLPSSRAAIAAGQSMLAMRVVRVTDAGRGDDELACEVLAVQPAT